MTPPPISEEMHSYLQMKYKRLVDYATSFLRQFFTTSGEKLAQVHEFAYVLFAIFFLSSNSQNNRLFHVDAMKF